MRYLIPAVIAVTILLLLMPLDTSDDITPTVVRQGTRDALTGHGNRAVAYVSHDPFVIESNSDFAAQGWPGSGTQDDPFRIAGINVTAFDECVVVKNTNVFFLIEDSYFECYGPNTAITFVNVTSGAVENCTMLSHFTAMCVVSSECSVTDSVIEGELFGISLENSATCSIERCVLRHSGNSALSLTGCDNCALIGCNISDSSVGISLSESTDCNVTGNRLEDCELRLSGEIENWHHDIRDNYVSDLPLGYFWGLFDDIVFGTEYGQVIMANCTRLTLFDGSFSGRSPVVVAYSSECVVSDVKVHGCDIGARLLKSENCRVTSSVFSGDRYGIAVSESVGTLIRNCTIYEERNTAVGVDMSPGTVVDRCELYSNSFTAIEFSYSPHCQVTRSTVHGNGGSGVHFYYSEYGVVSTCNLTRNVDYGISLISANGSLITNSSVTENGFGIYLVCCERANVSHCDVSRNAHEGVVIWSNRCTVTWNNITQNGSFGVLIAQHYGENQLYGNLFADNGPGNALDDGDNNLWDDGSDLGNIWSDFNGTVPYQVPGFAHAVDQFPSGIDSDGDGLLDWTESHVYGTDPHDPDTDNDGVDDGAEIAAGRDPTVPFDSPVAGSTLGPFALSVVLAAVSLCILSSRSRVVRRGALPPTTS
ncbi:MAG: right-handed parallel beta-helix repeat-containing protein [Candidatus Thorarchaeota archaeon]